MLEVEFYNSVLEAGAGGCFDILAAVMQRTHQMIATAGDVETERNSRAAMLRHGRGPTAVDTRRVGLSEGENTPAKAIAATSTRFLVLHKVCLFMNFLSSFFTVGCVPYPGEHGW